MGIIVHHDMATKEQIQIKARRSQTSRFPSQTNEILKLSLDNTNSKGYKKNRGEKRKCALVKKSLSGEDK